MILTYEDYLDYCEATDTYPLDPRCLAAGEGRGSGGKTHSKQGD